MNENLFLGLQTCTISGNTDRIINGVEVTPHSWPWTVRLFLQDQAMVDANSNSGFACGGSVIAENWVLTALQPPPPKWECQCPPGEYHPCLLLFM